MAWTNQYRGLYSLGDQEVVFIDESCSEVPMMAGHFSDDPIFAVAAMNRGETALARTRSLSAPSYAMTQQAGQDLPGQPNDEAPKDVAPFPRATMADDVAAERYGEIEVRLDPGTKAYHCLMSPQGRPSYTPGLLADIARMQSSIQRLFARHARTGEAPMHYFVLASKMPGIYNLGGDLSLFAEHIRKGDRAALSSYARACIDVVYNNAVDLELPIVSIALVQGDALGGGFEAALSCDVVIAERGTKFGLPEILFNLFPGMGAYSFLARRLDSVRAEKIIMSGRLYTAEELHAMGIVDVLADVGAGRRALDDFIRRNSRRFNAHCAVYQARRRVQPIAYDELRDITDIWVDTALRLTEADLRKMQRLTQAQDRRRSETDEQVAAG